MCVCVCVCVCACVGRGRGEGGEEGEGGRGGREGGEGGRGGDIKTYMVMYLLNLHLLYKMHFSSHGHGNLSSRPGSEATFITWPW